MLPRTSPCKKAKGHQVKTHEDNCLLKNQADLYEESFVDQSDYNCKVSYLHVLINSKFIPNFSILIFRSRKLLENRIDISDLLTTARSFFTLFI